MSIPLSVVNLTTATFECTFGRGCDGICCQNGRPPVEPAEAKRIQKNLAKFLPHLRPEARKLIDEQGFLSNRMKIGHPMLRVVGGWCVFFNQGCVLHKVGGSEGETFRYKPSACALFPLEQSTKGNWYVRQWGVEGEQWDLFCLNPKQSPVSAAESLRDELELAASMKASG
ncbi:MAG: DUF3109 family protein [Gemmataceae bacterium]